MTDLITNVKEINEKQKSSIYVLYADDMLIAASYKTDMEKFLLSEDTLLTIHDDNLKDANMIHGLVLDPSELPFEIPKDILADRYLWLFKTEKGSDISADFYKSIEVLTSDIEEYMEEDDSLEITDFAVILAEDIDLGITVAKTGTCLQISRLFE